MGMPNNLVLIRHGESEGNIAVARSKQGDHRHYTEPFTLRHSSEWRLSDLGIIQAQQTGDWIRKNLGIHFDHYYSSEYIRAMETAAHLNLDDASWTTTYNLRERTWGTLDRVSAQEREQRFKESMKERTIDPFYWTPPNGESIATLCLRIDRFIATMHRECDNQNVIIVCHGEVMWAFRMQLERMTQEAYNLLDGSKDPRDRIHNCQVIHYTRTNPVQAGYSSAKRLQWMRSFCPCRNEFTEWTELRRIRYTNDELLQRVRRVQRIVE